MATNTEKVTGMTELAAADVAAGDMAEIVDVSDTTDAASGTNKKLDVKGYVDYRFSAGATGSFTAGSGETITVVNGLITAIT